MTDATGLSPTYQDFSGTVTPQSTRKPALSDRLPRAWIFPLLVFAVAWVLTVASWRAANVVYRVSTPWTKYFLLKDASYTYQIALHGYAWPPQNRAFFPLLPMLVRGAGRLMWFAGSERYLWAGLVIQVLAGAASCLAIWALAARCADRRIADRAVIGYCAFPGAMMLGMLYTETLGIALAAACLLAALNRRWPVAGILGLLDTANHATWLILAFVLGIVALREIWTRRDWASLIAPVLTPLGMLAYFAWLGTRYHDYLFWFHVEHKYWGTHIDFGVRSIEAVTWTQPGETRFRVYAILLVICFAASVVGCVMLLRARVPFIISLYTVSAFIYLVIAQETVKPRFFWCLFGIFIGAAAKLPRWLFWPVTVASAGLLAFCIAWWPQHPLGPAP